MIHRGYWITYDASRPITGRWRAVRFGVSVCAGTEDAVKRIIDQRIYDAQNSGPIRSPSGYHIP